jgi:hypothetical protein
MEVSGEIHSAAALTPRKSPPVPIRQEAKEGVRGCAWEDKILLSLRAMKFLGRHYTYWATVK